MSLCLEIVLTGASLWLAAYIVCTAIERARRRRDDEAWIDAFIARNRAELTKHYRNGQFRSKNLWNQPR